MSSLHTYVERKRTTLVFVRTVGTMRYTITLVSVVKAAVDSRPRVNAAKVVGSTCIVCWWNGRRNCWTQDANNFCILLCDSVKLFVYLACFPHSPQVGPGYVLV